MLYYSVWQTDIVEGSCGMEINIKKLRIRKSQGNHPVQKMIDQK